MTRKAETIGRLVQFYTKGQKQFSKWRGVWKKFYRSNAEAVKAAQVWTDNARII